MLFQIKYVDTNMIYLNEVLKHFIRHAVRLKQYRKKSLFFSGFIGVHDDRQNSIDTEFKAAFKQIEKLSPDMKKRLKRMYINHQRLVRLCQGEVEIIDFTEFPDDLKTSLNKLGNYLYSNALNNTSIRKLAIQKYGDNNSNLHDLWKAFEAINGKVCCFCGIQEYAEQLPSDSQTQWRPAFDHYLPKDKYPLAAVNFKNLLPCCNECNSKSKGSQDPCNCTKTGRKKALNPYNNTVTLGLEFVFIKEKIATESPWAVELQDENDEKHQTWNRLYKIKDRVKSRLDANYISWIKVECDECLSSKNIQDAKKVLQEQALKNIGFAKDQREGIHKAKMMQTLASVNDDLLESILKSIEPDPQPDTLEEGKNILSERGIVF